MRTLGLVLAVGTMVAPPGPGVRAADPLAVLHRWDAARAAAYAADDPVALRDLYVAHSTVAAHDLHLLHEYDDRRLRITSMEVQVFAARVLQQGGSLRLALLERTVATACGPRACRRIAPDRPRRRVVVLRRVGGGWRVSAASSGRR